MLRFWMARTRTALTHASNSITPAFLYCRVKREEERCFCQIVQAVPQGLGDTEQHVPTRGAAAPPTQGGGACVWGSLSLKGAKGVGGTEWTYKCPYRYVCIHSSNTTNSSWIFYKISKCYQWKLCCSLPLNLVLENILRLSHTCSFDAVVVNSCHFVTKVLAPCISVLS